MTYSEFIAELKKLLMPKEYPYLPSSTSSVQNVYMLQSVSEDEIKVIREKKEIFVSINQIKKILDNLQLDVPLDIEKILGGSGNTRSIIESLFCLTPSVFYIRLQNRKHIVLFSLKQHSPGALTEIEETEFKKLLEEKKSQDRQRIESDFKNYLLNVAESSRSKKRLGPSAVSSYLCFIKQDKLFDYNLQKWQNIQSVFDILSVDRINDIIRILSEDPDFVSRNKNDNSGFRSRALNLYRNFLNFRNAGAEEAGMDEPESIKAKPNNILQGNLQIFFGSPGTGKSHKIDYNLFKDEKGICRGLKNSDLTIDQVWRTTFHPDYDYAQFVGSYKPKKEGEKISYSFVPQVFAKAYVTAWEKMLGLPLATASVSKPPIKYTDQNGNVFTIVSVENEKIETVKDMVFSKETIVETWTKCWESGEYKREGIWNTVIEWAICDWLINHTEADSKKNFEIGWGKLQETLQKDDSIRVSLDEGSKEYLLSYETDDSVHVFSSSAANRKKTIAKNYDAENIIATSAITCLQLLLKQRDANDFEHAWNMLKQEFNRSPVTDSFASSENKEVYLVIEEINRGNCAQIFGDIFQLLDRKDGWSEYPIDVDSDFAEHIREKMGPNFQKYKEAICERLDDKSTTENVEDCDFCKIAIPPNLNILATMNTSDQSLFPMDSAFKRRFDWEYVPIDYGKKDADFTIELDDTHSYKWLDFLKKVNADIYKTTDSEDKQMGEFFIKPKKGNAIDLNTFRSKVLFYLWDSVYKDETEKKNVFHFKYPDDNGDPVTFQSLFENNEKAVGIIGKIMEKLEVKSEDRSTPKPESSPATEPALQS